MFDLKVTAGTIVDGTGSDPFVGDVAITDGVIVAVRPGGGLDGEAVETIDATGLLVTPGFVDVHTHYDGQVTWDEVLDPSTGHGVTTLVMGNCGVGFAPVRPAVSNGSSTSWRASRTSPARRSTRACDGTGSPSRSTSTPSTSAG